MIITENLKNELVELNLNISQLLKRGYISQTQMNSFLSNLEKRRFAILKEIRLYNETVEYNTDKIKTISDEYKAWFDGDILKIYIPEPMPSYKNLKTHAFKNILLNLIAITKPFDNLFKNEIFIFIKVFENIENWDIDNKFVKLIPDALIYSGVIRDDNINKMFYCAKGEFSDTPHTEVYICDAENIDNFFQKYIGKK